MKHFGNDMNISRYVCDYKDLDSGREVGNLSLLALLLSSLRLVDGIEHC